MASVGEDVGNWNSQMRLRLLKVHSLWKTGWQLLNMLTIDLYSTVQPFHPKIHPLHPQNMITYI